MSGIISSLKDREGIIWVLSKRGKIMRTGENAPDRSVPDLLEVRRQLDRDEMEVGQIARNPIEALLLLKAFNELLHKSEAEAQESRKAYVELYERIPTGLITLDKNFLIQDHNSTASNLLGKEKKQLLQHTLTSYISKQHRPVFKSFVRRIVTSKRGQSCEVSLSLKGKEPLFVLMTGIPVHESSGELLILHIALLDISKYKQAEVNLSLWNEVENAVDPYVIFKSENGTVEEQSDLIVEYAGRSALSLLGYGTGQVIGKSLQYLFPALDIKWLKNELVNTESGEEFCIVRDLPYSELFVSPVSSDVTLELKIVRISDSYLLSWRNITERRIREKSLLNEMEQYKLTFENIPIGAYTTTSDGRIIMANPALLEMLGYSSFNELSARNLEEEGYENITYTRERFKNILEREGEIKGFESAWVKKNGEIMYVRENARVVRKEKDVTYYEGTVEDITREKRTEGALEKSEALTRAILNSLSAHVAVVDQAGQIIAVNDAWEEFAKKNNAKGNVGVGANYLQVCRNPESRGAIKAYAGITGVLNGSRVSFTMEYPCHSSEEKRWFVMNVTPLRGGGATISHLNITRNIEDRERLADALDALYQKEAMLVDVQRLAHVGSFSFNLETNSAEWSEGLFSIFEREPNLGPPTYEEAISYVHPEDRSSLEQIINRAIEKKTEFFFEHRLLLKENKIKYVDSIGRAFYDMDGKPVRLLSAITDITDRKLNQDRLERMSSELQRSNRELEQFAFVVSHDLQEPLRMITSYINLLVKKYEDKIDEKSSLYLNYIVQGADRMKSLISNLLDYSRVSARERVFDKVDLNKLLEELLDNFKFRIQEQNIKIEIKELPVITAETVQMKQLFQNLIGNSIKFRSSAQLFIKISAEKKKDYWLFRLEDNGIGIERKDAERIFGIFQRLHEREQYPGTGIGLAICKKIVERHGGRIWAEPAPEKGSVFYFTIPFEQNV